MKSHRTRPRPHVSAAPALAALVLFLAGCAAPRLDPAPAGSFSLVALPDTQNYVSFQPDVFRRQVRWILDNRETQRIAFVTHLGDIVEWNNESEWKIAESAMRPLEGALPFGLAVGNHDIIRRTSDISRFSNAFPGSRFYGYDWYGGDYPAGTNQNSYQTFEAAGMSFLVIHLVCNAPDDVLDWARSVLDSHEDRRVIVVTHMFLGALDEPDETKGVPRGPTGVMRWTKVFGNRANSPQEMWDKLLSRYPNIFLVLSGDQSDIQALHATLRGAKGNDVHAAMSDYGDGSFRVYRFLPSENRIDAITFSAETGRLVSRTDRARSEGEQRFSFPYEMSRR